MLKPRLLFLLLVTLAMFSLLVSLDLGSYALTNQQLLTTLLGHGSHFTDTIIFQVRLPRTVNAFVVGGLLALAGTLMQVLLRNPLADPYILGVAGGAAVATLISILLGVSGYWLTGNAFCGAIIAILLLFILARGPKNWSPLRLLLIGIILASGWAAIISFILTISPNHTLHSMLFWLMGDISQTNMPYFAGIILMFGLIAGMGMAQQLNILMRGNLTAQTLGVNIKLLNGSIYLLSALLTATAVTIAGTVGFIGLIVPHMVRLLCSANMRVVIPGSVLLGGSLLVIADTIARIILAPQELPVGILTAMIGIPIFLFLIWKEKT